MTRQILITITEGFREIDIPDLVRDLGAQWGVAKAEYLDGPRSIAPLPQSRSDLDLAKASADLAQIEADIRETTGIPAEILDEDLPKFDASVIEAAKRAAQEAEAAAGGSASDYVVPSFDPNATVDASNRTMRPGNPKGKGKRK